MTDEVKKESKVLSVMKKFGIKKIVALVVVGVVQTFFPEYSDQAVELLNQLSTALSGI